MQSPTMKPDTMDDDDSELGKGDLNFGRDDSDRGDIKRESGCARFYAFNI